MSSPRASIVIPNWNGWHLLQPCLDSLEAQDCRDALEVIVVDNASSDGSVEAVRDGYPKVRLLVMDENLGFAGGTNVGFAAAQGEVLIALNNDTEASPNWASRLLDALERYPDAGMAAPRMVVYDSPSTIHSAGDCYGVDGIPNSRGVWQEYGPPYDQETYVFGACGGAAAYRREMIEQIGSFDEAFFMYCEDVDLNWRAQLKGYRCVYVPDAVVRHHISATGGGTLSSYYVGRNTLWVMARNMPTQVLRRHWSQIVAAQWRITLDALRAWRGRAARARLRGQLAGLLSWPRWLRHRRRLLRQSGVSEDYIESLLTREKA